MIVWPQNAYVGQKVVCIAPDGWQCDTEGAPDLHPRYGQVCTISKIKIFDEKVHFFLVEYAANACFHAEGFRPAKDTLAAVEKLKRECLPASVPEGVA